MPVSTVYQINTLLGARGVLTSLSAFGAYNGTIVTAPSAYLTSNSGSIALLTSGFQVSNSALTQDTSGNLTTLGNLTISGALIAGSINFQLSSVAYTTLTAVSGAFGYLTVSNSLCATTANFATLNVNGANPVVNLNGSNSSALYFGGLYNTLSAAGSFTIYGGPIGMQSVGGTLAINTEDNSAINIGSGSGAINIQPATSGPIYLGNSSNKTIVIGPLSALSSNFGFATISNTLSATTANFATLNVNGANPVVNLNGSNSSALYFGGLYNTLSAAGSFTIYGGPIGMQSVGGALSIATEDNSQINISSGTGPIQIQQATSGPIYLGNSSNKTTIVGPLSAKFSVQTTTLTAVSINSSSLSSIIGNFTTLTAVSINSSSLSSIVGNFTNVNVTGTLSSASSLYTSSLTADTANFGTISALSANLGALDVINLNVVANLSGAVTSTLNFYGGVNTLSSVGTLNIISNGGNGIGISTPDGSEISISCNGYNLLEQITNVVYVGDKVNTGKIFMQCAGVTCFTGPLSAAASVTIGTSGRAINSYFFGASALVAGSVVISCPGTLSTSNIQLTRGPLNGSASLGNLTVTSLSSNAFTVVSYTTTLSVVGGDVSTVFYTVKN